MGEAASLPPEHPQRIEMQGEVSRLGAWAESEWLSLLEEGERWRLELGRVDVPEGLEDRLLRIPAESRGPALSLLGVRPRTWLAVAAALLVGIGVWLALGRGGPEPTPRPLDTLAMLAVNDHFHTHSLDVTSSDPKEVESGLRAKIPFEIRWPEFDSPIRLEGGRRCTLGTHPVCFSTWRQGGVRFTLLQVRRRDFDLPEGLRPTTITPKEAAAGRKPMDVLIWTEGADGWALVADDPAALAAVRPRGR